MRNQYTIFALAFLAFMLGVWHYQLDKRVSALENKLKEIHMYESQNFVFEAHSDGDSLSVQVTPEVEVYKPTGTPPSYAKPESYTIFIGGDGKYYIRLPGGTILSDDGYRSYDAASKEVKDMAAKSMKSWLTNGGF